MPDRGEKQEIARFVNEGSRNGSRVEEADFENQAAVRKDCTGKPIAQATSCFAEQRGKASRNRR